MRIGTLLTVILLFISCHSEHYKTGDGKYSYLRSDFVEAHTSTVGVFDYVVTDDGDTLSMQPYMKVSWAQTPDSLYRCLLYYNHVNGYAEPVSARSVPVVACKKAADIDTVFMDKLTFESVWISRNRKYLNVGFSVKTGKDGTTDRTQRIGLVCDSIVNRTNGRKDMYLRIFHEQNGVPEYYSSKGYMSLPLQGTSEGTTIHLSANTYNGKVEKTVSY